MSRAADSQSCGSSAASANPPAGGNTFHFHGCDINGVMNTILANRTIENTTQDQDGVSNTKETKETKETKTDQKTGGLKAAHLEFLQTRSRGQVLTPSPTARSGRSWSHAVSLGSTTCGTE